MSEDESQKVRVLHRTGGQLQPGLEPGLEPIVLDYKGRKKKARSSSAADNGKEKYSRGLADIQRLEGDAVRVAQRATKALSKSIDTYDHERRQSAKAKRDGAIEDFAYNSAKAVSVYMKEASDIPIDLVDAFNRTSYRKQLRDNLRLVSRFIRMIRI
jgi:hypothetical protein